MGIVTAYQNILSPEDKRFVLSCLEDDDLVLAVRRLNNKHTKAVAEYISGAVGCEMSMAAVVARAILKLT